VSRPLVVFDMDGTLVDARASYGEAVLRTVRHFTGREVSWESVVTYKLQGGWNNDWDLCQRMAEDLGVPVSYASIVEAFDRILLGEEALLSREVWIPDPGFLERLAETHGVAIFTGRSRREAEITLGRSAPTVAFRAVVCAEDVATPKPAPEGLHRVRELAPGRDLLYVGDAVDDARSARAAGVPFVGVSLGDSPLSAEAARALEREGAAVVLPNINLLEALLEDR